MNRTAAAGGLCLPAARRGGRGRGKRRERRGAPDPARCGSRSCSRSAPRATAPTATARRPPIRTSRAQPADYITRATRALQGGRARQARSCSRIAATLSDADMAALGAYFAQQKPKGLAREGPGAGQASARGSIRGGDAAGAACPACAACHSPERRRHPEELSARRRPVRRLHVRAAAGVQGRAARQRQGRQGRATAASWSTIASRLTDAQMKALADYIAGLR